MPNGLLGTTTIFNKISTGIAKEIYTSSIGSFAFNLWDTNGDFTKTFERTFTVKNLLQNVAAGAIGGFLNYKTQESNLTVPEQGRQGLQQIRNNLEILVLPRISPAPVFLPIRVFPTVRNFIPN